MKYRNEGINKKKKNINFILIYSFIAFVSIFIFLVIRIGNKIDVLNTEIPLLETQLENINNSILSEDKRNKSFKRLPFIQKWSEQKGMIKADDSDSNIIHVWWDKGNNINE